MNEQTSFKKSCEFLMMSNHNDEIIYASYLQPLYYLAQAPGIATFWT